MKGNEEVSKLFRGPAIRTIFGQINPPGGGTVPSDGIKRSKAAQLIEHIVSKQYIVKERRFDESGVYLKVLIDIEKNMDRFDSTRRELKEIGMFPRLVNDQDDHFIIVFPKPKRKRSRTTVNLILLISTIITTVWAGSILWITRTEEMDSLFDILFALFRPMDLLMGGLTFAFPLLLILGTHELGHYFTARRYGIDASLPYFIPIPPFISPIGTFGALISMKEPISNKRALIDIGAAGPIAGFIVAIPVTIIGLILTNQFPVSVDLMEGETLMTINPPLLFRGLMMLLRVPNEGVLFPTAFAGWLGLFVTALNLLPVGQLDGGHIIRGSLGDRSKYISMGVMGMMVILGLLTGFTTYILFAVLILFMGVKHPPPLDDISPLSARQISTVGLSLAIMVLTFHPLPLETITVEDQGVEIDGSWGDVFASPYTPSLHNITVDNPGTRDKEITIMVEADGENLIPSISNISLNADINSYGPVLERVHYHFHYEGWYIMLLGENRFDLLEGEKHVIEIAYGCSFDVENGNMTDLIITLRTDKGAETDTHVRLVRAPVHIGITGQMDMQKATFNVTFWNLEGIPGFSNIGFSASGLDFEPEIRFLIQDGDWTDPYPVAIWNNGDIKPALRLEWGADPNFGKNGEMSLILEKEDLKNREISLTVTMKGPGPDTVSNTIFLP